MRRETGRRGRRRARRSTRRREPARRRDRSRRNPARIRGRWPRGREPVPSASRKSHRCFFFFGSGAGGTGGEGEGVLAASRALWGSALCRVLPSFERARSSRLGSPRALDTLCPRREPAPEEDQRRRFAKIVRLKRNAWENVRPERCPVSSRIISPPTGKISPKQKILRKRVRASTRF